MAGPTTRRHRLASAAPALLLLAAALVLARAQRGLSFFFDEWDFVTRRLGWDPSVLLVPHNEHLSAAPVLVYKVLLETAGLDDHWAFRLVLIGLTLLCGLLVAVYASRRVGPWIALGLAGSIMLCGPAWQDLLWSFQIGFLGSLAAGLGALLALDRGDRAGEALAAALLALALACSSLGVPILLAAGVEVAAAPDRRRRAWLVALPAALYALWHWRYGVGGADLGNLADVPRWVADAADDAAGALVAVGEGPGRLVLAALVVLVAGRVLVTRAVTPRLLALLALPLAFWGLTALGRADDAVSPAESRYLLPGALWLALIAVEALRGWEPGRLARWVVAAVAVVVVVANARALQPGADGLRESTQRTRGAIAALELAGPAVPYVAPVDPVDAPQLVAGRLRAAMTAYGSSPGWPLERLARAPGAVRAAVDAALLRLAGFAVRPAVGRCAAPSGLASAPVARAGLVVRASAAPVEVRLRRFAPAPAGPAPVTVPAREARLVDLPDDAARPGWAAELRSAAPFTTCPPA